MNTIKIEKSQNIIRDLNSKALMNTDINALDTYKKQVSLLKSNSDISNKINKLEEEVGDLKNLLNLILEKIGKNE